MTLADTDDDLLIHGRIGYGTRTPWALGALLVIVVAAIGIATLFRDQDNAPAERKVAPEFSLHLFDGSTFNLADYRGQVVVVNFWASWCEPCREEMPALQQSHQQNPDVVFVGIGAKTDDDDDARAFASEYGVTYAIGRDTEGENRANGPIQEAFGVVGFPSTYVIDPEGNIATSLIQPIPSSADLQPFIDDARKPEDEG